jgi:soluble calcium-activated nucleotidase 1
VIQVEGIKFVFSIIYRKSVRTLTTINLSSKIDCLDDNVSDTVRRSIPSRTSSSNSKLTRRVGSVSSFSSVGDNEDLLETGVSLKDDNKSNNTNNSSHIKQRQSNKTRNRKRKSSSSSLSKSVSTLYNRLLLGMLKSTSSSSPSSLPLSLNGNGGSSVSSSSNGSPVSGNGTTSSYRTLRSESMAYPRSSRTNSFITKIQLYMRQNTKAVIATTGFVIVLLVLTSDVIHDYAGPGSSHGNGSSFLRIRGNAGMSDSEVHWGGASNLGRFNVPDSVVTTTDQTTYHFAAVSDLDQLSVITTEKKPTFRSALLPGTLTRSTAATTTDGKNTYELKLEENNMRDLITKHNEAGRGAEFSELLVYNNRLLTFDDRTGDVFEIFNTKDGAKSNVAPRFVITEGNGDTDKGMKWEWATIKDGELYLGSMGKEYTNSQGVIENTNNLWIAIIDKYGTIRRVDWEEKYKFVRHVLGADAPGYIIMEAIMWSDYWKKWIFLPRRISSDTYDDVQDEQKGATKLVMTDFTDSGTTVVDVKINTDPYRGFSSFAFVPGTKDQHAIAIRSVEENCTGDISLCKQRSYFVVFDIVTGEQLSEEVQLSHPMKFEGIEFVNIYKQ